MIGILDYGLGNISAFNRLFYTNNIQTKVINSPADFSEVSKIIFPGVGAFDDTINKLNKSGLRDALDHAVLAEEKPILGVCIGMHVLGNSSEEGREKGLGYIDGSVRHIQNIIQYNSLKSPHMGWNSIHKKKHHLILDGVDCDLGFYFLHSYAFVPDKAENIICYTNYHFDFVSGVNQNHVYGFQFHPEKSHMNGISLLSNFSNIDA